MSQTPKKIIIDCDPGQDDALMLFMAFAVPEQLDILGLCAVAGNVSLDKTARNLCMLREISNREDIPAFAGCDRPLVIEPLTAEHVHGQEGLDGIDTFTPRKSVEKQHAVDFIIETLKAASDHEITLVVTGPMTNIAVAVQKDPSIISKIKEIVMMGGAMREGGNITPSAEFNIYVDPHAAKIICDLNIPLVVFGLDVTHQVFTSPALIERLQMIENAPAQASQSMLSFFGRFDAEKYGAEGSPLHDPCTVAYLLAPDLFKVKNCNMQVEADSPITAGHTAIDFWHVTDLPKNIQWAYEVDREGFFDLLVEKVKSFS